MNPGFAPAEPVDSVPHGTPFHPRVLRRIFSFPVALAAILVLLAVLTVRSRFDDPDMWWHLRTGEIVWTTHTIPTTDLFSYTTGHHAWVPHEWLSQTVIYGAYRFGNYPGLMLWLCVMASALLVSGFVLCAVYAENVKVAFLGALIIWLFATIGLAIRPQMVGYLFLILELLLLHLGRTRNPRWFFCLPPLFALWVNCHGSFFLGFVIAGVTLAGASVELRIGSLLSTRWEPRGRRLLAASLLLSAAALFLNPDGLHQIFYPVTTMAGLPLAIGAIEEWRPLLLNTARGIALMGTLASIFVLLMARRAELYLQELLLMALGTWLAVSHARMLFVFGILVAPTLCRLLSTSWDAYDPAADRPLANAAFMAASLLIVPGPSLTGLALRGRSTPATQSRG